MVAFALDEALAAVDRISDAWANERARPAVRVEDGGLRPDERYAADEDFDDVEDPA